MRLLTHHASTRLSPLLSTLLLLLATLPTALAAPRRRIARATPVPAVRRQNAAPGFTFQVTVTVHVTLSPGQLGQLAGGTPVATDVVAFTQVAVTPALPLASPRPTAPVVVITQYATEVETAEVTDYEWVTEHEAEPETTPAPTEEEGETAVESTGEEATGEEGTVSQYGQCGGNNWEGGTKCIEPWECQTANEWYAQCL